MFYNLRARAMKNEKLSIRLTIIHLLLQITHLIRKQNLTTKLALEKLTLCVKGRTKCQFCGKF